VDQEEPKNIILKMEDDLEYYEQCLEADFFIYNNKILLSDLEHLPKEKEISKLLKESSSYEIEKYYNHFHMCFITTDIDKQRKFAIEIWNTWRLNLTKKFPNEHIEIQLVDNGSEIILYVCRPYA